MTEFATFAAGCFWGVEVKFRMIPGVVDAIVGYSNGHTENPTYKDVCTDETGHAEVVQVEFDPQKVSYATLVDAFWHMHDPIHLRRIMHVPERIDQSCVAHLLRIKFNLHHFRVACLIRANIFVRWIFGMAIAVAHDSVDHSRNHPELHFHSPETPSGKRSEFSHFCNSFPLLIVARLGFEIQMQENPKSFQQADRRAKSKPNYKDSLGAAAKHSRSLKPNLNSSRRSQSSGLTTSRKPDTTRRRRREFPERCKETQTINFV